MGIFVFMYVALLLIHLISSNFKNKEQRLFQAISCFLLLWLIQGLRHETIGVDSATSYRPYFELVSADWNSIFDLSDTYTNFEIGYIILNKFFKVAISTEPQLFILFTSFLALFPVAFVFYKYSTNIILSFTIFASFVVYYFGFSGVRQAIAIGICTLCIHFIIQRNVKVYIPLVLLASTIHTSAILFLPAYWLYNYITLDFKRLVIVMIGAFILSFSLKSVVTFMITILFGGERYLNAINTETVPSYNLMLLFLALLIFTYISKNEMVVKLRSLMIAVVMFQLLGLISTFATRLCYYYLASFSLAIPLAITSSNMSNKKSIEFAIAILSLSFFMYANSGGYLEVTPYKFFWE